MAHGRAEELTGRRRYVVRRHQLNANPGCLVLQVEVSFFSKPVWDKCGVWACEWRDATVADVAEGELYRPELKGANDNVAS